LLGGCSGTQSAAEPGICWGLAELALHVVPCLARYTFGRREELCGVDVDDVLEEDGIPYIFIRPNEHRTLKNPQAMRRVPLIGEGVRLEFLQYHALKKLGHKLLFPKLRAASDRTPLGDTFYGDWTKVQNVAGPTPPSRRRFSIRFARAEAPGIVRVELGQPPGRSLTSIRPRDGGTVLTFHPGSLAMCATVWKQSLHRSRSEPSARHRVAAHPH